MEEITSRISDQLLRVAGLILGVIILVSVLLYLRSSDAFVSKYTLHGYLAEDSGLSAGSPVYLDGVRVGSATRIGADPRTPDPARRIEIVMHIDDRYHDAIRGDSVAWVGRQGLGNHRLINIQRGFQGSAIAANGEIRFLPTQEITVPEALDFLKKVLEYSHAEKTSALKNQVTPDSR
jgi:ABC-type transporter Mla subunit MlaD